MPVPAGGAPVSPPAVGPLTYDPTLSRVRIEVTGLDSGVTDTFSRVVAPGGWGTSDSGHVWTVDGAASQYRVAGDVGVHAVNALDTVFRSRTTGLSIADPDLLVGVRLDLAPTGLYIRSEPAVRFVDASNYYGLRVHVQAGGLVDAQIVRVFAGVPTVLANVSTGVTYLPGVVLWMRFHPAGSLLRGRVWRDGTAEPQEWQVTAVDSTHTAGDIALATLFPPGNTNALPYNVVYTDLSVTATAIVERSTDLVRWSTVRGGESVAVVGGVLKVDDYEFAADVANYYRMPGYSGSIIPVLGGVWLKSVARPFLNRRVSVRDFSEVTRPNRGGVFEVVGRSFPVAVTDVRGSRRWTLQLATDTPQESNNLDLLLAGGDILLVHVPQGAGRISAVPGGYVTVGDTREVTPPTFDLQMRVFELPCVEVAAPGPDVIGSTVTCQSVLNTYATCQAVLDAHPTCVSLMELVGDPTDVLVP